ncbi:MAG: IPT/TIG domain-containing protein [Nitrososphaerales archaeon]
MKMGKPNIVYLVLIGAMLSTPMLLVNGQVVPIISNISPIAGTHGSQITITGSGFDRENNDVGFTKVVRKGTEPAYSAGYVNNVPSPDGRTLVFELPEHVGVCAYSTMDPDSGCILIALMLDPGEYEVFVVNKNGKSNSVSFEITGKLFTKIQTRAGELTLSYHDGLATLSGILHRSTACVNWVVNVSSTKDNPPSHVEFHIFDENKGVICIQLVGEPQEITATAMAGEHTEYKVMLEDETVFSGTLVQTFGQKDVNVHLKIKKSVVLLSIWNNEQIAIHKVKIESGAEIIYAKARGWTIDELANNQILLQSDDRPITGGTNLIVLLAIDDRHTSISWEAFDEQGIAIAGGVMIP